MAWSIPCVYRRRSSRFSAQRLVRRWLGLFSNVCKSMIGCTLRLLETSLTLNLLRLDRVSESSRFFASATGEDDGESSKEKRWCVLRMELSVEPNFTGLKRMALANGKCGSNASWTKDYAYPRKTQATICDLYSGRRPRFADAPPDLRNSPGRERGQIPVPSGD
jgi:hypothetical protein